MWEPYLLLFYYKLSNKMNLFWTTLVVLFLIFLALDGGGTKGEGEIPLLSKNDLLGMAEGRRFELLTQLSSGKRLAGARTRPLCDPSVRL
jgi:hypothetical protein